MGEIVGEVPFRHQRTRGCAARPPIESGEIANVDCRSGAGKRGCDPWDNSNGELPGATRCTTQHRGRVVMAPPAAPTLAGICS